jgi:hypothetical protein
VDSTLSFFECSRVRIAVNARMRFCVFMPKISPNGRGFESLSGQLTIFPIKYTRNVKSMQNAVKSTVIPYNNFRLVSGRKPAGDFRASRKIERIVGKVYRKTFWKFLWIFSEIFEQMFNASRRSKSFDYFSGNKNSKKVMAKINNYHIIAFIIISQLRIYSRETYANAKNTVENYVLLW